MMSKFAFGCLCFALLFLQGSALPFLLPETWRPDLWLCATVISALVFDRRAALVMAILGGFSQDIIMGNWFGLHLFPYILVALGVFAAARGRYNREWLISVLAVAAGTVLFLPALWLTLLMGGASVALFDYIFYKGLPLAVMNVAAAPFLHHALWRMKREWVPRW